MRRSLTLVSKISLFILLLCLLADMSIYLQFKSNLKDSIDISTKAAAMQINMDLNKISEGIFEIDEIVSKQVFYELMSLNTNTSKSELENCTVYSGAINTTGNFVHPLTAQIYTIEDPTFIAILKFKFNGLLIHGDLILMNNMGGSSLYSR